MDPDYVKEIAATIMSQFRTVTKMAMGVCRVQALTMTPGQYEFPGVGFNINPAVHGWIPLDVDIENKPHFKMVILLNVGADTYIVQRYQLRHENGVRLPEAKKDWELEGVYFDDLDELLFRMTTIDPPEAK